MYDPIMNCFHWLPTLFNLPVLLHIHINNRFCFCGGRNMNQEDGVPLLCYWPAATIANPIIVRMPFIILVILPVDCLLLWKITQYIRICERTTNFIPYSRMFSLLLQKRSLNLILLIINSKLPSALKIYRYRIDFVIFNEILSMEILAFYVTFRFISSKVNNKKILS